MMLDVLIALLPAVLMSLYVFGSATARIIALSVVSCLATEAIFQRLRGRAISIADGSAIVTGLILALSLPWTAPWYIPVIGGVVAIGIGKMVYGGLGYNIFNPAMVGRAFLMICFAQQFSTWMMNGQGPWHAVIDATTGATPLSLGKGIGGVTPAGSDWLWMFLGNINGSLGETSAVALLLGGLYLVIRRSAAWQIPAGVLIGAMVVAGIQYAGHPGAPLTPVHHLFGGALLFGAFFIATDPVSSPVSVPGRWVFGLGVGVLTMLIRLFSSYPEGVMFAVLLMNMLTPMINRWTIPVPVGGKGPRPNGPKPA